MGHREITWSIRVISPAGRAILPARTTSRSGVRQVQSLVGWAHAARGEWPLRRPASGDRSAEAPDAVLVEQAEEIERDRLFRQVPSGSELPQVHAVGEPAESAFHGVTD